MVVPGEIAQQTTLALKFKKLNPEQGKIYKSGMLLADISRLSWNSKYSDSEILVKFLQKT